MPILQQHGLACSKHRAVEGRGMLLEVLDLMSLAVESASLKREQKRSETPVLGAGNTSDTEGRGGLCCALLCGQPGTRGISDVCLSKEGSDPGCSKPATNQICPSTLESFSSSAPLTPFGLHPKCFHGLDSSGCFPSTTLLPESLYLAHPLLIPF